MHKTDETFLQESDFRVDFLKFNSLKLCETFHCVWVFLQRFWLLKSLKAFSCVVRVHFEYRGLNSQLFSWLIGLIFKRQACGGPRVGQVYVCPLVLLYRHSVKKVLLVCVLLFFKTELKALLWTGTIFISGLTHKSNLNGSVLDVYVALSLL